jgi:hypothetical protein
MSSHAWVTGKGPTDRITAASGLPLLYGGIDARGLSASPLYALPVMEPRAARRCMASHISRTQTCRLEAVCKRLALSEHDGGRRPASPGRQPVALADSEARLAQKGTARWESQTGSCEWATEIVSGTAAVAEPGRRVMQIRPSASDREHEFEDFAQWSNWKGTGGSVGNQGPHADRSS